MVSIVSLEITIHSGVLRHSRLSPHESSNTDLILVGHSLGGILAAEVALMETSAPESTGLFKHRVLGIVNLDVPFLGLHPGVISTGLGSLFRPKDKSPQTQADSESGAKGDREMTPELQDIKNLSTSFGPPSADPNFNPVFPNDVRLKKRGRLEGALNFVMKNSNRLFDASKQYVTSRFEFTSCMADYPSLERRYRRLRELEDVDECQPNRGRYSRRLRRVRFVNYYSAATGRRKPEEHRSDDVGNLKEKTWSTSVEDLSLVNRGRGHSPHENLFRSVSAGPRIPDHSQKDDTRSSSGGASFTTRRSIQAEQHGNLKPNDDSDKENHTYASGHQESGVISKQVQTIGRGNEAIEESLINKQQHVSIAEYAGRNEKPDSVYQQDSSSTLTLATGTGIDAATSERSRSDSNSGGDGYTRDQVQAKKERKKKKDRVFCALPQSYGRRTVDPLWVRVQMDGMDEVVAHQSLFVPSATYEKLVGDTVARIERWVQDDLTTRAVLADIQNEQIGKRE